MRRSVRLAATLWGAQRRVEMAQMGYGL